jgi:NAD dependent epimerase/dehydratase family enzyme
MADAALLASARVLPMRLLAAGFRFQHPSLADAFATALAK